MTHIDDMLREATALVETLNREMGRLREEITELRAELASLTAKPSMTERPRDDPDDLPFPPRWVTHGQDWTDRLDMD